MPHDGLADLTFALYARETAGILVCSCAQNALEMVNELLTLELYFDGANCFDGDPRWLEVSFQPTCND